MAFLVSNRVEIMDIDFALAKGRLVGVPPKYRLAPVEMISLMRDIGAKALIAEGHFDGAISLAQRHLPEVKRYICCGQQSDTAADSWRTSRRQSW